MIVKGYLHVEITRDDRFYSFSLPVGATYEEAEAVTLEALGTIRELAKKASETAAALEKEKEQEPENNDLPVPNDEPIQAN